ncbi:MAG: methyltransferase [Pseudomonadota bacterium]
MRTRFDAAYYRRFYEDQATRAGTPASARRHAAFISGYLKHLELPVRSVLDLGCGLGRLLRALGREYPRAKLTGVEYSDYLCERYGWQPGSVVDCDPGSHDLVVCVDVLSYLSDDDCAAALRNLARLTQTAAVLGIVTAEDREICDFNRTDRAQRLRPAAWYRRRLSHWFEPAGGGLYLRKPLPINLWTLDRS